MASTNQLEILILRAKSYENFQLGGDNGIHWFMLLYARSAAFLIKR